MAYGKDAREALRRAYIFSNLPLDQVACAQGVSLPTARRWKKAATDQGDDWDKTRAAQLIAGGSIEQTARAVLAALVSQCQVTTEAVSTNPDITPAERVQLLASLADAFSKATAASKKILPETDRLAVALSVMQKLGEHITKRHKTHRVAFVEILETFSDAFERDFT